AEHLGHPADAARASPEAYPLAPARQAARVGATTRGAGEHRAAGSIEGPGEDVQHVDEPARAPARFLRARANTGGHSRSLGGGELAGEAPDDARLDPATAGRRLGRERLGELADAVDARDVLREVAEAHETIGEERVHEREEEMGVRAGTDEVV